MDQTQSLPPKRSVLRLLLGLFIGLAIGGIAGGAWTVQRLWHELPPVDHLADYEPKLPLRIHARDGTLLAEYGEERREFVPVGEIPLHVRQALLAIEDDSFYQHRGVDFMGIARAAWSNLAVGGRAQGGSTITMQVARMFFLSREKTYSRKLMEVLLAHKLETTYSKDKLLELYMNQVFLGQRAYGFAAAATAYFGKPLRELTLGEAAMLAGLPKAPSAYNPIANRERAVQRQQYILSRMHALGWIDAAAHAGARAEPLALRRNPDAIGSPSGHAVEQARKLVVEQFGEEAYTRGLDVTLTIDPAQQLAATRALRAGLLRTQEQRGYTGPEGRVAVPAAGDPAALRIALAPYADSGELKAALVSGITATAIQALLRDGTAVSIARKGQPASVARALQPDAPGRARIEAGAVVRVEQQEGGKGWRLRQLPEVEGALVSLDAQTGEILALAGGFDARFGQYDHAVQAVRQPGSTFKPFVFSAGLEKGFFPATVLQDAPREVTSAARGRKAWTPRNYGNRYEGETSARRALIASRNVPTVNLMEAAGAAYVQDFTTRFGFDPQLNPAYLPLALGSGGTTPLGLARAYAVFANGGELVAPRLISGIRERNGAVLYAHEPQLQPRAISPRNAYVMDTLLRDVVRQGTGRRALEIGREDVAGKTGTSNDARDVWFAGYSSGLASVVWMGYDQPRSLGRATGGTHALPVWTQFMKEAVAQREPVARALPGDVAVLAGDYVYAEYLDRPCVEDGSAHVEGPFGCDRFRVLPSLPAEPPPPMLPAPAVGNPFAQMP